ncbi:hypothetical protein V6N13_040715 [Hibiscus sabdariffa]
MRNEENETSLLPANLKLASKSWIWRNILSPLSSEDNVFSQNIRLFLGKGNIIKFWSDVWIGLSPLKDVFPRIFVLATDKCGVVADFESEVNGGWQWKIVLRRRLFDWEKVIWDQFLEVLSFVKPVLNLEDSVRWAASANGFYTPKPYCDIVSFDGMKLVWPNFAPPKVEAFMWRLVHGRIPTRDELFKRGVGNRFCDSGGHSISHPVLDVFLFSSSFSQGLAIVLL